MIGANWFLEQVRAMLRRPPPEAAAAPVARFGGLVIDFSTHSVTMDEREVRLSRAEFGLLSRLVRQGGSLVDKRALLEEVWRPPEQMERAYLRLLVQALRMKLEDDPEHPHLIVGVGCRGYRLGDSPAVGAGEAAQAAEPPRD